MNSTRIREFFESTAPERAGTEIGESDFTRYYAGAFGPESFPWFADDISDLVAHVDGPLGCALDLGCGYGVTTMWWGDSASHIVGLELRPARCAAAKRLEKLLRLAPAHYVGGRANNLPFGNAYFDTVLMRHVLEHLWEPRRAIEEVWRVLRPGGILVLKEGNNVLNPSAYRRARRIHRRREVREYVGLRFAVINDLAPDLGPWRSWALARRTRGYTYGDLARLLDAGLQGQPFRFRPRVRCVHPISRVVEEQPLNPFGVRQILHEAGFRAEILLPRHYRTATASPVRRLKRRLGRMLWPALVFRYCDFQVRAVKPKPRAW